MSLKYAALPLFLAAPLPALAGNMTPPPADPVIAPPPVVAAPVHDWTGPSLGLQLSYGDVNTDDPDTSGDGGLYGLRAGYDYDFGSWVAGGSIQYSAGDIALDDAASLDGLMRIGGRVGYDAGPTLIYGTGGYAKAFMNDDDIDPGDSNGYYLGVGLETYVTDKVSVGGEINYNKFADFDVDDMEADATTLDLFVNYRF